MSRGYQAGWVFQNYLFCKIGECVFCTPQKIRVFLGYAGVPDAWVRYQTEWISSVLEKKRVGLGLLGGGIAGCHFGRKIRPSEIRLFWGLGST